MGSLTSRCTLCATAVRDWCGDALYLRTVRVCDWFVRFPLARAAKYVSAIRKVVGNPTTHSRSQHNTAFMQQLETFEQRLNNSMGKSAAKSASSWCV